MHISIDARRSGKEWLGYRFMQERINNLKGENCRCSHLKHFCAAANLETRLLKAHVKPANIGLQSSGFWPGHALLRSLARQWLYTTPSEVPTALSSPPPLGWQHCWRIQAVSRLMLGSSRSQSKELQSLKPQLSPCGAKCLACGALAAKPGEA